MRWIRVSRVRAIATAAVMAASALVAGCKIHETSVAETTIAGKYVAFWLDGIEEVGLTMIIQSPDTTKIVGTYTVGSTQGDEYGMVTGAVTDSVRIQFKAGTIRGTFTGAKYGIDTFTGTLQLNYGSGHTNQIVNFRKQKFD